ncbi:hypothetical protein J8M20_08070 [Pseudoalteromonas luteoviolacea]|uniref:hypothetical protein n=1 Tax=Pseudoalteromonas luteoviolacea TaxID=43657 RepID=UPI001B3726E6|nr:hypothetical protein [Pseudoalteromonas luteoviolacea]MBQ4811289.1 hypothetical protein [Pseudoalteromonas luteoviolacea]
MKVNDTVEVLEKLKNLYECKNLTELSRKIGKNSSWAAQAKKNDALPLNECRNACIEFGVSMDWFLFGKEGQSVDKAELLNLIQEGLYESKELAILEGITLEQLRATSALVLKQIESIISTTNNVTQKNKKAV